MFGVGVGQPHSRRKHRPTPRTASILEQVDAAARLVRGRNQQIEIAVAVVIHRQRHRPKTDAQINLQTGIAVANRLEVLGISRTSTDAKRRSHSKRSKELTAEDAKDAEEEKRSRDMRILVMCVSNGGSMVFTRVKIFVLAPGPLLPPPCTSASSAVYLPLVELPSPREAARFKSLQRQRYFRARLGRSQPASRIS